MVDTKNKRYKSVDAIKADQSLSPQLKIKLASAFEALKDSTSDTMDSDILYINDNNNKDMNIEKIDGIDHYVFQANTLTYAVPLGSTIAEDFKNSKIGIVYHTKYDKPDKPTYEIDTDKLGGPGINVIDHKLVGNINSDMTENVSELREYIEKTDPHMIDRFSTIQKIIEEKYYAASFKAYVNYMVLRGDIDKISAGLYTRHANKKIMDKEKELKTRVAKDRYRYLRLRVTRGVPLDYLEPIIDLYKFIMKLKNQFLENVNFNTPIKTYRRVGDRLEPTAHEGVVVVLPGDETIKLVNRDEFSHINFLNQRRPNDNKRVAITYGRFNPPTKGHRRLVDTLTKMAGESDIKIFVSRSHDNKKNPLPPEIKLKYVREMFSEHKENIFEATHSLLPILVQLYQAGYRDLAAAFGSDRADTIGSMIKEYNGVNGNHGFYNFDEISVVLIGRDEDHDFKDISSISASISRECVRNKDKEAFMKTVPTDFKLADEMYNDLVKYMR